MAFYTVLNTEMFIDLNWSVLVKKVKECWECEKVMFEYKIGQCNECMPKVKVCKRECGT